MAIRAQYDQSVRILNVWLNEEWSDSKRQKWFEDRTTYFKAYRIGSGECSDVFSYGVSYYKFVLFFLKKINYENTSSTLTPLPPSNYLSKYLFLKIPLLYFSCSSDSESSES